MRKRMLAPALVGAMALIGCEGDPSEINNTVTTGHAPPPGAPSSSSGGMEKMGRAGGYPMPKGTPPGGRRAAVSPEEDAAPSSDAQAVESSPAAAGATTPQASLGEAELKEIAKLPAEEQELANAQMTCMITGELLGSMGMPVRVEHDGTIGFLCCKGCLPDFNKDPAAAIAKIKK